MTVYTMKEVSEILKVSEAMVKKLCRGGAIETFNVGANVRITEKALTAFMEKGGTKNSSVPDSDPDQD